jgi:hypothetical protein
MVVDACNPRTWEAKAGVLQVPGQPEQLSKTYEQKKKRVGREKGGRKEDERRRGEGRGRERKKVQCPVLTLPGFHPCWPSKL